MLKLKPKSRTFYKMYLVNIVLMICFVSMLSFVSTEYSSKLILNNITEFNQQIIDGRKQILEDKIRQLDEVADAVVADNDVVKLILTGSMQYYSPIKIANIIGHLKSVCSNYSLVDDISLIDYDRGIVITNNTKFPLREMEALNFTDTEPLLFQEVNGEVKLKYRKELNSVLDKKISLILVVNLEAFQENLFIQDNKSFNEYLVARDGMALSENKLVLLENVQEQGDGGNRKYSDKDSDTIVYKSISDRTGLAVVGIQNYSELTREANKVAAFIIIACILIIILASLILYFFSLEFYRPLKKLNDHISNMEILQQNQNKSEYDYIESVVDTLQDEKEQIRKKYDEALPVLIQRTCYRLIVENYEEEAFQYLTDNLKRKMAGEYYAVLLIECEKKSYLHELEDCLLSLIQKNSMEAVYADISVFQGIFMLNTSLPYYEFLDYVEKWKEKTKNWVSTWCVSQYFASRANVNLVCWENMEKLKQKFYIEKNAIIYNLPQPVKPQSLIDGQKAEQRLLADIKEGDGEAAIQHLHSFTAELTERQMEIRHTIFIYFKICDRLLSDLKISDVIISRKYNEKSIFLELFSAQNIYELEKITTRIINLCVENIGITEKAYSDSVQQTLDFIKNNYQRDLTLADIANGVYLSTGHLSKLFKEETGCTVIEYMTGIRMKKAAELLSEIPVIKIKDVGERVGYYNVQSFIRYFKKYYGVTPVEFRKKQIEN